MSQHPDAEFLALQEALAGRYSLEWELGRGGMGVVYLARDVRLERRVAIKLLPPVHASNEVLRERFLREARTAAKLSHPNIVPIFAVDEVDGFVFFVMAYVEGETLGQRVRKRGPLGPREGARVLREVSWALAYAHGQGVVHRDVKPDNVLLEAGSGRALVTDFGIAHAGESTGLTSVGELLGTPEYMSPEQASGEAVDGRTDLYALGVMGHFVLSAKLPLQGPNVQATLAKQITQAAPPLATVAPELPELLCDAMDRCLAKDPAQRFQEGGALAEALGRVLDVRYEMPAAIRVFIDQNRDASSAVAAVVMMVLMVLVAVGVISSVGGMELVIMQLIVGAVAAWLAVPVVMLSVAARRLLKAGHGHDELVHALGRDVEERRRELGSQVDTKRTPLDVWAGRAFWAGLVLMVLTVVGLVSPLMTDALFVLLLRVDLVLLLGGGLVTAVRHALTRAVPGERWLSFWKSPIGRGLFGVAGIGVDVGATALGGAHRPTEIAIGMAVERLFDELPKDVRRSLGDLPGVVEALEAHAERMRARLKDLDRVLGDVGEQGAMATGVAAAGVAEKRGSVTAEVEAARGAAEARLREVVAALESIRLELLRLHAGSGTVESMTADLTAARALAADMERVVEARGEVDALLAAPVNTPPEPAPA